MAQYSRQHLYDIAKASRMENWTTEAYNLFDKYCLPAAQSGRTYYRHLKELEPGLIEALEEMELSVDPYDTLIVVCDPSDGNLNYDALCEKGIPVSELWMKGYATCGKCGGEKCGVISLKTTMIRWN